MMTNRKSRIRRSWGVVAFGVAVVCVIGLGSYYMPTRGSLGLQADSVPEELTASRTRDVLSPAVDIRGSLQILTNEGAIRIKWSWSEPGELSDLRAFAKQVLSASFKPTAVAAVGSGLLVGGFNEETGRTEIEFWEVDAPHVGTTVDPNTGFESHRITPQPLSSRRTLLSTDVVGMRNIRCIFGSAIGSDFALVQFWDSKDVYLVDWSAGPPVWTLQVGANQLPSLAFPEYRTFWRGDHMTLGLVYGMEIRDTYVGPHPTLFFDADRDGALDSWIHLDPTAPDPFPELSDAGQFTSLYGVPRE